MSVATRLCEGKRGNQKQHKKTGESHRIISTVTTFFKLANLAGVTIQSQVGISLKAYTNLSPASAHRIAICACEVASPEKITPPITPQLPVQQFHRDYAGCHFFGSRTEILTKMVLTKSETLQAVLAKPKQIPVIITADCEQNRSKVVLQNRDRSPENSCTRSRPRVHPASRIDAPKSPLCSDRVPPPKPDAAALA